MEVIKYRNTEGDEAYIGPSSPYYLTSKEGFGAVDNILTTQKTFGIDGDILIGESLEAREIRIEGTVVRNSLSSLAEDRRELIRIFNPKTAGTIFYELFDNKYMIDVRIEHAPIFRKGDNQELEHFEVRLRALDPYWRDTSVYDSLIPLSKVENKFTFPLILTEKFVFASFISGEIIEVDNSGSVEVGGVFKLKLNGEVTNPRIYNVLTQEYFGFNGTYPSGTEFEISTVRGKKRVTRTLDNVTTNAMSERMPESVFLQIRKGANYFQIQAEDEVNLVMGTLNFTPLVLGV